MRLHGCEMDSGVHARNERWRSDEGMKIRLCSERSGTNECGDLAMSCMMVFGGCVSSG